MKRLMVLIGSLCAVSTALATTYVRVEKDGTKTYSDRPIPGGVPVELESAQTYSSAAAKPSADANAPAEQRLLQRIDDFRYTTCAISPANDETFVNPPNVPISVSLSPVLRPTDAVTLTVDGKVVGQNTLSYTLQPADRGTHTVRVTIKDEFGREVCNSSTAFHVQRPSLNMPGRR